MGDREEPVTTGNTRWVRLSRRLDASAERVFRAWADPEELARWLPDRIEGGLAAGGRSVLVGPDSRVWWDVVEVHAPTEFVFRRPWTPDERLVTTVRVAITPIGYGTRLDLEDGPFPLDAPGGLDAWAASIQAWGEALVMLRASLDFSVDVRFRR